MPYYNEELGYGSKLTDQDLGYGSTPTDQDLGYGATPTDEDLGYGATPTDEDLGYGANPMDEDLGYGSVKTQDLGYEQDLGYTITQDYGYGNTQDLGYGNTQDLGYGNMQDLGYGNTPDLGYGKDHDDAANKAKEKKRPKRRCSVTRYSLAQSTQAQLNAQNAMKESFDAQTEMNKVCAEDNRIQIDKEEEIQQQRESKPSKSFWKKSRGITKKIWQVYAN